MRYSETSSLTFSSQTLCEVLCHGRMYRSILQAALQNSVLADAANQHATIYLRVGDDQGCLKSWSLVWFQEVLPSPELNSDVNTGANSLWVRFWHFTRHLHLKLSIILTVESHLQQKDKKDISVAWHLVTSFYGWWISLTWQVQSYRAMDGWVPQ